MDDYGALRDKEKADMKEEIATLRAEVERLLGENSRIAVDNDRLQMGMNPGVEKAERERDEAKGRVFRRDDFIIELQHEIESARDAARGENALRLEAERERDEARESFDNAASSYRGSSSVRSLKHRRVFGDAAREGVEERDDA